MVLKQVVFSCVMMLVVAGCTSPFRHPYYFWGLTNGGPESIRNVDFRSGHEFASTTAIETGLVSKTNGPGFNPIPEVGTITWDSLDGTKHQQQVVIAKNVPDIEHFKGTIFFRFDGKEWQVRPMTDAEERQRAIDGRPLVPTE